MANTKKRTYTKRKTSKRNNKYDTALIRTIVLIAIFVLSAFIALCNYSLAGKFGDFIANILFGLFGFAEYFFPLLFFYICYNRIFASRKLNNLLKLIAVIVIFFIIGMSAELISGHAQNVEKYSISDFYKTGVAKTSGGVIGGSIGYFFYNYLDIAGCVLIMAFLGLISILILLDGKVLSFIATIRNAKLNINYSEAEEEEKRQKRIERREARNKRLNELKNSVTYERNFERDFDDEIPEIVPRKKTVETPKKEVEISKEEKREQIETEKILNAQSKKKDFFDETDMRNPKPVSREVHEIVYDDIDNDNDDLTDINSGHAVNVTAARELTPVIQTYEPEVAEVSSVEPVYEPEVIQEPSPEPAKPVAVKRAEPIAPAADSVKPNVEKKPYVFPSINLLKKGTRGRSTGADELKRISEELEDTLLSFGVAVKVTNVTQGPSVTRYEMEPERGVKVSRIVSLSDDLKLALKATDIRIEAPIPGKSAVGIEVPNSENQTIMVRDMIEGENFKAAKSKLSFTVGKDISGKDVIADIGKMPHLLIAGTTGSGKSVFINTIIMSILYNATPEEVNLIMVDPKVVELSVYNGIPHLMYPVITDPQKASGVLKWCVKQMEDRYKKFADLGVRDLAGYNEKAATLGDPEHYVLPKIVIIIDELADLMMVCAKEVEESICRLAQLARACGMHLIVATQRPSVDVITGLIKANMPSRCALSVSSGVDSRTVIDMVGAEKLLGHGDMLFYPTGYPKPVRLQGAFISDEEIGKVVEFLRNQKYGNPVAQNEDFEQSINDVVNRSSEPAGGVMDDEGNDPLFYQAGRFVIENQSGSIGALQRKFKIGFNRAARIMDQLCDAGVVANAEGTKPRQIVMSITDFENMNAGD